MMDGWAPISTYPYGTKWAGAFHVLCCHQEKKWMRFGRWYPEMNRWYYSGTNERSQWAQVEGDEPTHWQKIPDLPTSQETA